MTEKEYSIDIKANAQKVWFALWDIYHYKTWTSVFSEGSYAITDNWEEGTAVHFLTPEGKGMYSIVSKHMPLSLMEFTHIGQIDQFKEQPLDEESKKWSGGKERYSISEENGVTTLVVTLDVYEPFMEYFDGVFPKAIEKVKQLAEELFITVQTNIQTSIEQVWKLWNDPEAITQWYIATPTWHSPRASNDFKIGGTFNIRMEAKDGSMGFDLIGKYTAIEDKKNIEYSLEDDRRVRIIFESKENGSINILQSFEAETENSLDLQRNGWQAILDSFKNFVESN